MGFIKNIFHTLFYWENDRTSDPDLKSIKLNPFTLVFPKTLENRFRIYYYRSAITQINISAIGGAILFSLFFPFDLFLVPELFYDFLFLRVGLGSFIIILALVLIKKSPNKKYSQPILSIAIIAIASINITFIVLAFPKLNTHYYIGIILIYFWAYTFLKLRFVWASFSGISIFIIYLIATKFIVEFDSELFLISSSYIFASNLAGMGVAYALEFYSRWNYVQTLKLKRSLNENIGLHKKITESKKVIGIAEEKLMLQSKALESAANSITILNKEGMIIWSNKAFSELTGYTAEEVIGKNPRFLKSGKHDRLFYKNMWSTVLAGSVWSGEIINKKKNGDLYYEEMMITPVTENESKNVTHFIAIKQDITLRKDMEEELYESERRLRGLFENATMGIYRTTNGGDILMANNALVKMLGFDSIEELQLRNTLVDGYKNKDQRKEFLKEINETGFIKGFISEWLKKDGETIYIRESARLDIDENGETIFEGTVEDITLSKLAEIEIINSQERLQVIVDNLNDAIFIHDDKGKIINVNNKVLDLYNVSKEEVLELTIKDLSDNDNPFEMVAQYWKSVIENGKTFKFDWKSKCPTNNYVFNAEVFLSRITFGNVNYVLANVRDVTEQREAQRKLLITQKAVELNASSIYWIKNDATIVYVNKAAEKLLEYSFSELTHMKVWEITNDWNAEFWQTEVFNNLQKKKVSTIESYHTTKSGKVIPVEISASILKYEEEEIVIAIVKDITERRKTAQNLIEAKEKAEQSDKLKSEFLAGMSHEIRTPINTILNFTSLIKEDLGENLTEDINSSFEMIDSGGRRLIRTIDSILNMSQLQAGSYELKTKLISIVDEVLKPLCYEFKEVAAQKGLGFDLIINADKNHLFIDQYTTSQLFINLIDNSIKYTLSGQIKVVVSSSKEHIYIEIIDTGIGISEEFLPTLFEPFLQEEMGYTRSFEGNGLGLALVKKYLELNNGSISVESQKGAGSTFTVKFKLPNEKDIHVYNAVKVLG